jgi:glycosyltransferase involved in cell wall biosynthesis
MELKTFFIRLKYQLKKWFSYPLDIIKFNNEEIFSRIYFLSDNAGWAADRTTKSIFEMTKENNIKCEQTINHPRNQFVFYGDQYSLFSKNIFNHNNIISFDYEHGLPEYSDINKKLLNIVYENQKKISLIRVTNSFFKNFLIKEGINSTKIRQIPLTVNEIFIKFSEKKIKECKNFYGLPNDRFIIGSFHKDGNGFGKGETPKLIKAPEIFLKSIETLKNKNKIFILLTGPARGFVKKGLENLGVQYMHLDIENFEELPRLYNCLDLYLISSRDEGGPTGLGEAMACGIPIVSTKVGLTFDFITNGVNGYLAELNDYKKLGSYVQKLYEEPLLCEQFSNNSLKIISSHFKNNHSILWKSFFDDLRK